ncbi:MAG: hypothetical protein ACRDRO_21725, partial [Pseudonocardiaceae bacterium]
HADGHPPPPLERARKTPMDLVRWRRAVRAELAAIQKWLDEHGRTGDFGLDVIRWAAAHHPIDRHTSRPVGAHHDTHPEPRGAPVR